MSCHLSVLLSTMIDHGLSWVHYLVSSQDEAHGQHCKKWNVHEYHVKHRLNKAIKKKFGYQTNDLHHSVYTSPQKIWRGNRQISNWKRKGNSFKEQVKNKMIMCNFKEELMILIFFLPWYKATFKIFHYWGWWWVLTEEESALPTTSVYAGRA